VFQSAYFPPDAGPGTLRPVLETLKNAERVPSLNPSAHFDSSNACKACGLGMGGQRGGRTNELDQFPQICRKSVQAQSTDTQEAIPVEVFDHTVAELAQLSGRELEHLGRLNHVLYKSADSQHYRPLGWPEALELAAKRFQAAPPDRTFFYTSGRSSNEAGFVLQLLARLYGTNNVNNCSYYCHQATSVGLQTTVGTGTATVDLEQLVHADCIFVIGANPASNHPRFIPILKACRERGGQVIIINPAKEPGLMHFGVPSKHGAATEGVGASRYVQPNIGSDLWLFKGLAKALVASGSTDGGFIREHTEHSAEYLADLDATAWADITANTGLPQTEIEELASAYAAAENAVFAWGMGVTHHLHGAANVEAIANLALLRGMVGKPSAGLLPLRGHSNIQGMGTVGVKPTLAAEVLEHLETTYGVELPKTPGMDTIACMEAGAAGRVDAALMMGGNLFAATPHSTWAAQALDAIPFKLFLTTTLNRSHVVGVDRGEVLVFPVSARDEERQATTQESMFNYIRLSDGGPARLDNVRSEVDILCDLAEHLLPPGPLDFSLFRQYSHVQKAIAAAIPGMEGLETITETKKEFHVGGRLITKPEFKTPTKRASFAVRPAPVALTTAEFPFVLASIRSEGQFNSIIYDEADKFRRTETRWCVLMNAADIAALGLEGRTADMRSAHGEMLGLTVYAYDVPRGNALTYYPEANALTGIEHDPRSKTPAFKSTPVSIRPSV
jgi:molybdopterin-dependent oxidoreductase alpha subunit